MYTAKEVLNTLWDGQLPVRPEVIATSMGMRVFGRPDFDVSGMVELTNQGPVITFNSSDAAVRRRFTIAHEVGHYALGHLRAGHIKFRDPASHFSSSTNSVEEREANRFAAELLMPENTLKYAVERKGFRSIDDLASLFGVSQVAMKYRLENLGMVHAGARYEPRNCWTRGW